MIGKMSARYKAEGKKVLLAAADTFRAGATQQLQAWGERNDIPVVAGEPNADPASVVYDGVKTAIETRLTDELRDEVKLQNAKSKAEISRVIVDKLVEHYRSQGVNEDASMHFAPEGPTVILFVGVNGVGKTTIVAESEAPVAEVTSETNLDEGLTKTRKTWSERWNAFMANFRSVDEDFFEDLEETLIGADVGAATALQVLYPNTWENGEAPAEPTSLAAEVLQPTAGQAVEIVLPTHEEVAPVVTEPVAETETVETVAEPEEAVYSP
ncbi:signal recognition particle receptor subunit alpha [Weissella confusa]|uniref:Signal recognition particle receptor subunit alpha n=1 Tax=Weissella confusa TaxID=1583 RepID=A0A923SPY1_WEICO|nr:signal recognition particle receptor subunit alpha [Weissella confusa]